MLNFEELKSASVCTILSNTSIDRWVGKCALSKVIDEKKLRAIRIELRRQAGLCISQSRYNLDFMPFAKGRISFLEVNQDEFIVLLCMKGNFNKYLNQGLGMKRVTNTVTEFFHDGEINNYLSSYSLEINEQINFLLTQINDVLNSEGLESSKLHYTPTLKLIYGEANLDSNIKLGSSKHTSNLATALKRKYPKITITAGHIAKKKVFYGVKGELSNAVNFSGYLKDEPIMRTETKVSREMFEILNRRSNSPSLIDTFNKLRKLHSLTLEDLFEDFEEVYSLTSEEAREIIREYTTERSSKEILRKLFAHNGLLEVKYHNSGLYRNVLKLKKKGVLIPVRRSQYRLNEEFHAALCSHYNYNREIDTSSK